MGGWCGGTVCVSSRVNAFSTISHTKAVKAFIPRSHRKRVIDFLSPPPAPFDSHAKYEFGKSTLGILDKNINKVQCKVLAAWLVSCLKGVKNKHLEFYFILVSATTYLHTYYSLHYFLILSPPYVLE